jgi:hypothetical protein
MAAATEVRPSDQLGALQVLFDDLVERLGDRARAGLLGGDAGVLARDGGEGRLDGRDVLLGVVGVAAQADRDEHRAPAGGGQCGRVARAVDAADGGQALEAPLEVGGRGGGRPGGV